MKVAVWDDDSNAVEVFGSKALIVFLTSYTKYVPDVNKRNMGIP